MKKLGLLLVLSSLFLARESVAQVQFGARGGILWSSVSEEISYDNLTASVKGGQTGWTAGAVVRFKVAVIYLQPELLLSQNKYLYDTPNGEFEERVLSLDLPVLAGVKFGPFRANLGPEAHVNMSKSSDLFEREFWEKSLNTFTVGWVGGVGLDLLGLMIDVRYHGNLRKIGTGVNIGGETIEFDDRPGQWSLTAGLFF